METKNLWGYVNSLSEALDLYGSVKGMRNEFTKYRDMFHKRIKRAIDSGEDLTGTALERYVTGSPGHYSENLPHARDLTDAQVVKMLGQMQRSAGRKTATISGVKQLRKEQKEGFKQLLMSYGYQSPDDAGVEAFRQAVDMANSIGNSELKYDVFGVLSFAHDGDEDFSHDKRRTPQELIERALGLEAKNSVMKGSKTMLLNALKEHDNKKFQTALRRYNNSVRKYYSNGGV